MSQNEHYGRIGRRGTWVLVTLLVVAPLLAHAPGLMAPFHYDDLHSVQHNPHLTLANTFAFFTDAGLFDQNAAIRMYRPVLLFTYAVDDYFWGRNPFGFHLSNVLLHGVVAVLLHALLRALLRARRRSADRATVNAAAAVGALAFALHPLATEGVAYVSCRSSQLATLGFLGALLGYVRARRAHRNPLRAGWYAFALAAAAIAFGSKAIAASLPAALVLLEIAVLVDRPWRPRALSRAALAVLPFVVLTFGYLAVRDSVLGSTGVHLSAQRLVEGGHELTGRRSIVSNLCTQAVVFWRYLGLVIWPADLNIAHHERVAHGLAEMRVWSAALGLLVYAVCGTLCLLRRPLIGVALLFVPLALSPTSSLIPLNVIMSEHRMYLPLTLTVGLLGAVIALRIAALEPRRSLLSPLAVSREGLAVTAALVLLVWAARSAWRVADYRDTDRLWGRAVALAPDNYRARNYLGNALVGRDDFAGAREQFRCANRIYPEDMDSRINLGEANLRLAASGADPQAWDEGEAVLRSVIADEPRHVLARLKLGRLLFLRGKCGGLDHERDLEAAAEQFRTVIEMAHQPRFISSRIWARLRLADLEEFRGDVDAAIRAVRAVLREAPYHAAARTRLRALKSRRISS